MPENIDGDQDGFARERVDRLDPLIISDPVIISGKEIINAAELCAKTNRRPQVLPVLVLLALVLVTAALLLT